MSSLEDFFLSLGPVYYNRATAYEELGDNAKAEADFAKAKQLGYKTQGNHIMRKLWVRRLCGVCFVLVFVILIVILNVKFGKMHWLYVELALGGFFIWCAQQGWRNFNKKKKK